MYTNCLTFARKPNQHIPVIAKVVRLQVLDVQNVPPGSRRNQVTVRWLDREGVPEPGHLYKAVVVCSSQWCGEIANRVGGADTNGGNLERNEAGIRNIKMMRLTVAWGSACTLHMSWASRCSLACTRDFSIVMFGGTGDNDKWCNGCS